MEGTASTNTAEINVKCLSLADISRASKSQDEAFASDPFMHYIFDPPDKEKTSPLLKLYAYIQKPIYWMLLVFARGALTIERGAAVVSYYHPVADRPYLKYIKAAAGYLHVVRRSISSPEARKRHTEFREKAHKAIKDTLGDGADDMFYLEILASSPAYQGRGFGTSLVNAVTHKADTAGKATYLISSNEANVPFYNSLGFFCEAQIVLGENNPTWQEKPAVMHLMVRKSKKNS